MTEVTPVIEWPLPGYPFESMPIISPQENLSWILANTSPGPGRGTGTPPGPPESQPGRKRPNRLSTSTAAVTELRAAVAPLKGI